MGQTKLRPPQIGDLCFVDDKVYVLVQSESAGLDTCTGCVGKENGGILCPHLGVCFTAYVHNTHVWKPGNIVKNVRTYEEFSG